MGEEAQIDQIPLSEVKHVKEMAEAASDDQEGEDARKFSHVMQIATQEEGFNSGRIYYLALDSKQALDELMVLLTRYSAKARAHAEAQTLLRKIQLKLRRKYESGAFQAVMALLIAAVNAPSSGYPRSLRLAASESRVVRTHCATTYTHPRMKNLVRLGHVLL